MAKVLKWTNKLSNEQGYVKSLKKADGHFNNTWEITEAKKFSRQCDLNRALKTLDEIGECEANAFEAVEV